MNISLLAKFYAPIEEKCVSLPFIVENEFYEAIQGWIDI